MYPIRRRHNPPTAQQVYDAVAGALANSNLAAYDEFSEKASLYKQVIKEALEAKYGKPKPAPRKPKPKRKKTAPIPRSVRKKIEIINSDGTAMGVVDLPTEAAFLAAFTAPDKNRYGLGYIQWLPGGVLKGWLADAELAFDFVDAGGFRPESVFVATSGHALGVIACSTPSPTRGQPPLMFEGDAWKKAFKTGKLQALYESEEFPDFRQVLPNKPQDAKGIYVFDRQATGEFLAARPGGNLEGGLMVLRSTDVTYRYLPRGLEREDITPELFPYRALEGVTIKTAKNPLTGYNSSLMWDAFSLVGGKGSAPRITLFNMDKVSPGIVVGLPEMFAVVMPMRMDQTEEETKAYFQPVHLAKDYKLSAKPVVMPRTGAKENNPKATHILAWLKKAFHTLNHVAIGAIDTPTGPERWIVSMITPTQGCIRLPVAPGPEYSDRQWGPQQRPISLDMGALRGWFRVNWPTTEPIGGKDNVDAQADLRECTAAINDAGRWTELGLPLLRGLTALVSTDETRYGLTQVGLENGATGGSLIVSDGHKGLIVTDLPPFAGLSQGKKAIGIPAELFTGKSIFVNDVYAASGHLVLKCEHSYQPPDLASIVKGRPAPRQTLELTGPIISQILRFPLKKVNKGDPILVADHDGFKIIYAIAYEEKERRKIVGSAPFVKDLPNTLNDFPLDGSEEISVSFRYFKETLFAMTAKTGSVFLDLPGNRERMWVLTKWDDVGAFADANIFGVIMGLS